MLWGAIWNNGKCFKQFNKYMNKYDYIQLLEENIKKHPRVMRRHYFVQDRAAWHTAELVKKWFQENELPLINLPTKSPNLNAIELIWSILKNHVQKMNPTSQKSLEKAITNACENLDQKIIKQCIQHTKKEMKRVAES